MTARFHSKNIVNRACAFVLALAVPAPLLAQAPAPSTAAPVAVPAPSAPAAITPPAGYIIGPDDILSVVYWKDKDMTVDVQVRPDGKISLPLLNEMQAAGLTPSQLRDKLTEESKRYIEDPNVTVVVKQINSRKVFVMGEVAKPGPYILTAPTTVLQLLAVVGGLREYANGKKIVIVRTEASGKQTRFQFNYNDVMTGKNLRQNIELMPGDTIVVP
jgi:polysaccharide export outer membrane protein